MFPPLYIGLATQQFVVLAKDGRRAGGLVSYRLIQFGPDPFGEIGGR
jgi:hypothetical protein